MKVFFVSLFTIFIGLCAAPTVLAQTATPSTPVSEQDAQPSTPPEFFKAKVIQIVDQSKITSDKQIFYTQVVKVEREDTHEQVDITLGSDVQPLSENQLMKRGTEVILSKQQVNADAPPQYVIADTYRLDGMLWLTLGFFGLVIIVARKQGIAAIVGMFLSMGVLLGFVVPQIIHGYNPVLVTLIGSGTVSFITIYICRGFSLHSHVGVLSMLISLIAVGILSYASVKFVHLAGLGSEEAAYLQFGSTAKVNLQGLLLSGIMIGALGVLDDITLAQVSIVDQLHQTKPSITFVELYQRGLAVGKGHVASLVNTLILAYAAGSLPLFLLFTIYQGQPAWVTLNSELIAEEVVRTLTGSIGLVLAVPLSTFIASYFVLRYSNPHRRGATMSHGHAH